MIVGQGKDWLQFNALSQELERVINGPYAGVDNTG